MRSAGLAVSDGQLIWPEGVQDREMLTGIELSPE